MDMVVNSVFTLQDMLSGGLMRIRSELARAEKGVAALSSRMGSLALAMAPLAILSVSLALGFGSATAKAIEFESSMADVAKVVSFDTRAEFDAMAETILDMSSTIPMAADGIAAIISAAAQSGVAKSDLTEFAEQAAKMGVAFDMSGDQAGKTMADWRAGMGLTLPRVYSLADSVNHLSNNMNATAPALSEVLQRTGAMAMSCGLAETEVAALGAAFLSAGASPEIASTALKKFTSTLVKGEAMSKRQAEAFTALGFSSVQMAKDMQTNAQGTIFQVLQALSDKPKELQISLLTQMFGEEAIGAIAPLLSNMGNLTQAFELVGDASNYAGSMQEEYDARSKTTANTLQLLGNRFDALCITIGNVFLPYVNSAVGVISEFVDGLRGIFASPVGQWFLRVAASLASAVLAITAFAAGAWAIGSAMPFIAKGATALKGAMLGLGAPFWLIIGACYLLYEAYQSNFGGIADLVNGFFSKVNLVVQGVTAVFSSFRGGVGEVRGELAEKIEAAGLVGVLTTVSKLVNRFLWVWRGAWSEVQEHFYAVRDRLVAAFGRLGALFQRITSIFSGVKLFSDESRQGAQDWFKAGQLIGTVFNWLLDVMVVAADTIVSAIELVAVSIEYLCALFSLDFRRTGELAHEIFNIIGSILTNLVQCLPFGMGDMLIDLFTTAKNLIANFSFADTATAILQTFLSGIVSFGQTLGTSISTVVSGAFDSLMSIDLSECGRKILGTLIDGILSMKDSLVEKVSGVFSSVREYLPFSDAKKGPFSDLTTSGASILGTLGQGVMASAGDFIGSITGVFDDAAGVFGFGEAEAPEAPQKATAEGRSLAAASAGGAGGRAGGLHIENLYLAVPGVTDANSLFDQITQLVEKHDADDIK